VVYFGDIQHNKTVEVGGKTITPDDVLCRPGHTDVALGKYMQI